MSEALVLLPGEMCDARLFAPVLPVLSAERAVTIAPIWLGERVEEIASALLPQLPQRFALAGAGLGGVVAMELLRRAPERVMRIALMSASPLAETPQVAAERDVWIARARAGRLDEAVAAMFPPDVFAPGPGRMQAQARLSEMARDLGAEVFVRASRAMQRRRDQQATLRRCRVPALVLCGAEDPVLPVKRHSFLAELIPGAQLSVIEGAGHLPLLEAPLAVADALGGWMRAPLVLR